MEGFNYSTALKSKAGPWTFDELNEWLRKPSAYAPGTRMAFAGIRMIRNARTLSTTCTRCRQIRSRCRPRSPKPPAARASCGARQRAPAGDPPVETLLAQPMRSEGEADTKKLGCVACHTFNEGGKAGLGPNLYGVVGAPHGHMEGFNYSTALKEQAGSLDLR